MLPALLLGPLLSLVPQQLVVREVLAIGKAGERSRSPVYTDAVEERLARGAWRAPVEGETLRSATGEERRWTRLAAGEDGWIASGPAGELRGGWAWATLEVPEGGAWCLEASGHADVLVDGVPHAGDVYELGITRQPLALAKGKHEFLFRSGRGRLRAALEPAPAPVYLEERDRTLPDVIRGEHESLWIGTIVGNAGDGVARGYRLRARVGERESTADVPPLLPSSMRKCALALEVPAAPEGDTLEVPLELLRPDGSLAHRSTLTLAVRAPEQRHVRTFRSAIDGSVQYWAVSPPAGAPETPALILSLHGASVEARGQAACYAAKDWAVVVAPTNRRPFGFDWEDQGRMDALEVLELAQARFHTDPRRTLLTGHSMGGHGTWQLGAHFPGRFAAIAPSAGWRDFWSYSGAGGFDEADPIGPFLARAANASRTGLLESNYRALGVYVLHGDADDNVPVSEARAMREALGRFHPDFAYYERPGAGHWWGNECVDWPPLMEFLERHRLPEPGAVLAVDFTTADPAVSSRCHWLAIEAAERWLVPARVRTTLDPAAARLVLELENVARLRLDLAPFAEALAGKALTIQVGEARIAAAVEGPLELARGSDGPWGLAPPADPGHKSARRAGPFKAAFRHEFLLVYGTRGTPEENAWALAKARFDHEQWRYRGNGAVDVLADVDFRPEEHPDRDVILYGNQDTNAAWGSLLAEPPFDLRRGHLRVGERALEGEDLSLLAVYPRRDSALASVGVVGGTGLAGLRATTFLPYFVSGVGYPDWTVLGGGFLGQGLAGVRGAGFFGPDWSTGPGAESAWR